MKFATIVMSTAAIAAVFAACGGARDRGPNHNDASATETPANPASTPMNAEKTTGEAQSATSNGTLTSDGKTSWTEGPSSPGGMRNEAGLGNTNHTNTVTAHAGGGELGPMKP